MSIHRVLIIILIVGIAALTNLPALADDEPAACRPVEEWLVLGPVLDNQPVFEKEAGSAVQDALDRQSLSGILELPRAGSTIKWLDGSSQAWHRPDTDPGGLVRLELPAGGSAGRIAVTWLATSLRAERYLDARLELGGKHPTLVTLDGQAIEAGEEGDFELALDPGAHLLVVKTAFDPAVEADWTIGATISGQATEWVESTTDRERDLRILDVLDAANITAFDLAPDGRRILLAMSRVRPGTDLQETWVEVRSTVDGRLLASWKGSPMMSGASWAPVGDRLAYVTRNADKKTASLWLADLDSGATRSLLEDVDDWGGFLWSPTGDAIVYWTRSEPEKDERGIKRMQGLLDRMADHRTVTTLSLVTVPGGVRTKLTGGPPSTAAEAISPDGRRLLVSREVEDFSQRPYSRSELWELDLREGGAEKLRDFVWLSAAEYAPDGSRILIHGGVSTFGPAGLDLAEGTVPNDYDGQLYIWDPKSDKTQTVTRDFDPAVGEARWSRSDGAIYILAIDRDRRRIYRFDPSSGVFSAIETGVESVGAFDLADESPTVVATGTSVWQHQRLVAVDGPGETPRVLLEPAEERFATIRRGTVNDWDFESSDGRVVPGRFYLPPGFDSQRRYPAIVNYYAGTSPIGRSFGGRYPAEWWAANGYVVYIPNPTGAYGWGQAGSAVHVNDWGEVSSRQIIDATKAFFEAHPFVDSERVGCIGASYGGFETMLLLTKTDIFAAAVAHAGISALSSYWGEGYWGYSYGAVANADSFPWNRRDIFVDRSPLFHADRVSTPLLLTHGDADSNVPMGESDQFYAALKLLGVPVEYLRVAGLGHLIMDHDKRALWSQSILAWFDRWLKGQPEWWVALYPDESEEDPDR